jgi:hypothetical protein
MQMLCDLRALGIQASFIVMALACAVCLMRYVYRLVNNDLLHTDTQVLWAPIFTFIYLTWMGVTSGLR